MEKSKKSINMEGGFFLWRVEFFKIGKRDFTFIRGMRVQGVGFQGKNCFTKLVSNFSEIDFGFT